MNPQPVGLLLGKDDFEIAINEETENFKAILFYDGIFELESTINDFNKNFNVIDFWMVNTKLSPELLSIYGN